MIAVKGAVKRVARCAGTRYAKLLAEHERNEAKLSRALRAWDKSRAALRRAEKRLDADFNDRATAPDFNDPLGDPQSDGFGH